MAQEIIAVLIIALAVSALFVHGFRRRGPWNSFALFFLVIFLALLASLRWIPPRGPVFFGVFWVPLLIVGVIIALVMASGQVSARESSGDVPARTVIDVFFWMLLLSFLALIISGYVLLKPVY